MTDIRIDYKHLPPGSYYPIPDLDLPLFQTLDRLLPGPVAGDTHFPGFFIPGYASLRRFSFASDYCQTIQDIWDREKLGDMYKQNLLELEIRGKYVPGLHDRQIEAHTRKKAYREHRETLTYGAIIVGNTDLFDDSWNLVLGKEGDFVNALVVEMISFAWYINKRDPNRNRILRFYFPFEGGYILPKNLSEALESGFRKYVRDGGKLAQEDIILGDTALPRDEIIEEIILGLLQFPEECLGTQAPVVAGGGTNEPTTTRK